MRYSTDKELRISEQLRDLGVLHVNDLSIENLCTLYQIEVVFHEDKNTCMFEEDYAVIFINNQLSYLEQRQVFFHELAHIRWHHGNQLQLPKQLALLQEEQASFISLYYAMPRHLLLPEMNRYQSLDGLADYFQLPPTMVVKRCTAFQREQSRIRAQTQEEYKQWRRKRTSLQSGNLYKGTTEILHQLALQVGEESIHYDIRRLL
ncbi:hypothetical protein JCM19046_4153 [Bacillus sp. JCM 19046]|nr:hypothetical protein JCM19045_3474 [Bacillus sp. JCM 19045]GAF19498.1 hypothetical protein JCM19046_4153 [Bacillus sp. JCM 19046]